MDKRILSGTGLGRALVNVALAGGALLLALAGVELLLRTGVMDQHGSDTPVWIPPDDRAADTEIRAENARYAEGNRFGFTDADREPEKPPGTTRIAVLGDSFIWGDGLEPDDAWGHRLAALIGDARFENVDVLSWGLNGWSTRDELGFFDASGWSYDIDLLIVGLRADDADVDGIPILRPTWHLWSPFVILRYVFPWTHEFVSASINRIIERSNTAYGYDSWEARLYTPESLAKYSRLLGVFREVADNAGAELLFVLTPDNASPRFRDAFDAVIPLLDSNRIPYLDLQPAVARELGVRPNRALWANPANGNPGPELTELFARHTFEHLQRTYLPGLGGQR